MHESKEGWDLLNQGRFEEAVSALTQEISGINPFAAKSNRALALMNLEKYRDAIADFEAIDDQQSEYSPVFIGICLWLLGEPSNAIKYWYSALNKKYTDATREGVEVRALLFYGGLRMADANLLADARKLLKKVWHPKLRYVWPGPIAGYLLGKVSQEDFLINQTFENPTLEIRRQCQAHFWVGVAALTHGSTQRALDHFHKSANSTFGVLEEEYYLAKGEVTVQGNRETENTGRV